MVGLMSALFPPAPAFTEENLTSQSGKVFIVTGAASGVGFELAKMLYAKDGTVFIAARTNRRATGAISRIKTEVRKSLGRLEPMAIDLADLQTIKPAVESFLQQEHRLDVLVHNAGVMEPPAGSKTKQVRQYGPLIRLPLTDRYSSIKGHDLEMGTHALGPFVLTILLQDIMRKTAAIHHSEPYSIRIVWVTSLLQVGAPTGGVQFDGSGTPKVLKAMANYMESKVGCAWLAYEFAKRLDADGIMSVVWPLLECFVIQDG